MAARGGARDNNRREGATNTPSAARQGAGASNATGHAEYDHVQQLLDDNPELMDALMNIPAVRNIVTNPEMMRRMMMNSPAMREVMDLKPELFSDILSTAGGAPTNAGTGEEPTMLGGFSFPGHPAEGLPDLSEFMSEISKNPVTSKMMQGLLSNPQYMSDAIGRHPHVRALSDSNPELRERLQSPESLSRLTSPQAVQGMMNLRQRPPNQRSLLDDATGGLGADGLVVPNVPDGVDEDGLFGQFVRALKKVHHDEFGIALSVSGERELVEGARVMFEMVVKTMKEEFGIKETDPNCLAETCKLQANRGMQQGSYPPAAQFYSIAIALCDDNAVYYCNRAAAYCHMEKYEEAILDCEKAIAIDPSYSKAYSRLGYVYYSQGNYNDAIEKGFARALQLDPDNESFRESLRAAKQKLNIQVAEQKLQEMFRGDRDEGQDNKTGGN